MDVLVLGAGGGLGRLVCEELITRGHVIRTVPRGIVRDVPALAERATGVGAIVNCAGASVALGFGSGWRGYRAVDTPIGLAAAAAARRVGARLVYVGVHHPPALARTAYIDAHERVVHAMRDLDAVVVRATGFYSAYLAFAAMAWRGWLVDIGDGRARTNPIDERDLAAIVAESIAGDGPRELSAGGPQILTRAQIFEAIVQRARIARIPGWLGVASSAMLRIIHPRMGQFAAFAAGLAKHDVIAPALGTRSLADYLRARGMMAA